MQIINRLRGFISRQYDTMKFVEDWEKTNKVICVAGRIELTKFKRILDSWFFALWIASASIPLFGLIDLTNNPLATGVCLTWFFLSPLYASLTIYKRAAKLSLDETQEFYEDPENHFLKRRYFTRYWAPKYLAYDGGIEAFREEPLLWAGERFKLKPKKITDKASSTDYMRSISCSGKMHRPLMPYKSGKIISNLDFLFVEDKEQPRHQVRVLLFISGPLFYSVSGRSFSQPENPKKEFWIEVKTPTELFERIVAVHDKGGRFEFSFNGISPETFSFWHTKNYTLLYAEKTTDEDIKRWQNTFSPSSFKYERL